MTEYAQVTIDTLDPTKISNTSTVLVVGKRGQGKSYLCRDLLYRLRKTLDYCVGMSLSEKANNGLSSFLPSGLVYDEITPEIFKNIIQWHKMYAEIHKNDRDEYKRKLHGALYLDDCMAQKQVFKRKPLNGYISEIFKNGRHLTLFMMNAMQMFKDLGPEARTNADWIFVFGTQNEEDMDEIRKEYLSALLTLPQFKRLMMELTQNHGVLVIRNSAGENDLRNIIFRYKAQPTPEHFFVGDPTMYVLNQYYKKRESTVVRPLKASLLRGDIGSSGGSNIRRGAELVVKVNTTAKPPAPPTSAPKSYAARPALSISKNYSQR